MYASDLARSTGKLVMSVFQALSFGKTGRPPIVGLPAYGSVTGAGPSPPGGGKAVGTGTGAGTGTGTGTQASPRGCGRGRGPPWRPASAGRAARGTCRSVPRGRGGR